MRSDLQELKIFLDEVNDLTGKKLRVKKDGTFGHQIRWSEVIAGFLCSFTCLCIFYFFIGSNAFVMPLLYLLVSIFLFIYGCWFLLINFFNLIRPVALKLVDEVVKHNQIIINLDILDQLEVAGNNIQLNEREQVLQALKINKENLVRALKTDRILRENPKFKPEQFNVIDLSGLRALQTTDKATEYSRFLDEALQIGVSVQTEMRGIENERLGL